ncbi:MAG: hypothetical protein R2838_06655 [Caldilineaceae bacterium]
MTRHSQASHIGAAQPVCRKRCCADAAFAQTIVVAYEHERLTITDIAAEYELTVAQVEEALQFYRPRRRSRPAYRSGSDHCQ